MAKDYFQDIVPPQGPRRVSIKTPKKDITAPPAPTPVPSPAPTARNTVPLGEDDDSIDTAPVETPSQEKSIRNIQVPQRKNRFDDMRDAPQFTPPIPRPPRRGSRKWLWSIAAVSVVVLGVLLLISLRSTTVTVEPRTHAIVFDQSVQFTAYPGTAATGTLAYTVHNAELEDSEVVPSTGVVHAEEKASGTITVYNNTGNTVRLIKNTRFESANGKIFRAPADIAVPPKSGGTPGKVDVTVVADQVGEDYNVAAGRFNVPGLKGGADYTNVYGMSAIAMSGGFSGDRPGVAESDKNAARALLRSRLEQKARQTAESLNTAESVVFSDLMKIEYLEETQTSEANGSARVHAKARVSIPVFAAGDFAQAVARSVSADADNASLRLSRGEDFAAHPESTETAIGTDPIQFTLSGQGLLIWNVEAAALAEALAGRDQSAFQTVVTGFSGIQSARARIEPFWSDTFPEKAGDIEVVVEDPAKE